MMNQLAELGQYYMQRDEVENQLAQYAQDPSAKFRTKQVLLLVFGENGFERVIPVDYDQDHRLRYLYRTGPPNRWDATPTTGMPTVKKGEEDAADSEIGKKLTRLSRSIAEALELAEDLPEWEQTALTLMSDRLRTEEDIESLVGPDRRLPFFARLREAHADLTQRAIISVAWQTPDEHLRWVGDFKAFQQSLVRGGTEAATRKKGIDGDVKGVGDCCICGKRNTAVSGLLQVQQFKIYTLDKPGSISGGFEPQSAWRNFPACRQCCDKVDYSGERIKQELSFSYYGFKYLVLPSPVRPKPTEVYRFLKVLDSARVNRKCSKLLTEAEDDILGSIREEDNRLQVDLLFYEPDPQSFRPALYVSGLLPSRFQQLFAAQARADAHEWLKEPSPNSFIKGSFTFGCFRAIFPVAHGGSTFDDDFLAATRTALELRSYRRQRMIEIGMRWVQQDSRDGKDWRPRLANLFRSLLFFQELTLASNERSQPIMAVDYGDGPQATRVGRLFQQAPQTSRLRSDPAAQGAFLVGACCDRIEMIQRHNRQSTPFEGKYKGFRLNQSDIQRLFMAAKDKAKAYGPENENKVSGLLSCAACALLATPERWSLSPDEISYYFALGHALRPRLAKEQDNEITSATTSEG